MDDEIGNTRLVRVHNCYAMLGAAVSLLAASESAESHYLHHVVVIRALR